MIDDNPMTPLCGAKARSNGGKPCRRFAGPNGRCSNHGGLSTGPRTIEGKNRQKSAVSKHGYWTKESVSERKCINDMIRSIKNICYGFNEQ